MAKNKSSTPVDEPVDEPEAAWKCPQPACDRPLSAHIVTLASMNMRDEGRRPR